MKKYLPFVVAACFFSLPAFAQLNLLELPNPVAQKWPFKVNTIQPVTEKIKLPAMVITKPEVVGIRVENINTFERLKCVQLNNGPSILLGADRTAPQRVQLQWETNKLVDNSGFNIEQSFDDSAHFKAVDFVSSHLNSTSKEKYKLQNFNEYMNLTYYRLKQFKMDNSIVYSNIVSVDGIRSFMLYPNPAGNYLNVQIATKQTGISTIIIYDALGRALYTKTVMLVKNVLNNQKMNVAGLKGGIYYAKIIMADKNIRSGIFIKK